MSPSAELHDAIRDVIDFPKEGIIFKDITPILANGRLLRNAIDLLCETTGGAKVDKVAGIDARGFIFGAAVADRLGAGFVPIRKKGKLPWKTHQASYALEYGESVIEIHQDAISPGESVLLVDDLLATGGTAAAAVGLIETLEARIISVSFVIELAFLEGRGKLGGNPVHSLITY
jgi:adenine phosphoribosyltransferase